MLVLRRRPGLIVGVLGTMLWLSGYLCAQTPAPNAPGDQQNANIVIAGQDVVDQAAQPAPPTPPTPPIDTQIHPAGKLGLLAGGVSPLHLGHIGIGGVQYFDVYDAFRPSGTSTNEITRFSMLRTDVIVDIPIWKSHVLLDYTPEVAMLNGNIRTGVLGDQEAAFGTTFDLSARLSFTLKDGFAYHKSQQLFPDQFLLLDRLNGGVVQSFFLENPGTYLQNRLGGVLTYKLTSRWTVAISEDYRYADTHFPEGIYIAQDYVTGIDLTYALSSQRTIGFVENAEIVSPIKPPTTYGLYQTPGFFYSQRFSPSLWFTGKIGAERDKFPGFNNGTTAIAGSLTLLKTFSKSDLAIAYTRGSTLVNFITNRQLQQGDVTFGLGITKSLHWTNGGGYLGETGGPPLIRGAYGISTLEYRLPKDFVIFGNYTYRFQSSSTDQLLSGTGKTYMVGVRWDPRPKL